MSGSPIILAFDTSGAYCAAALLIGEHCVATGFDEMQRGQAERLFPMLEEVLYAGGMEWSMLDAIGVGTGPGNFTGIRIAVSAARGLAISLGVPAVGVSLFDALAFETSGPLLLCLPAPRDQFYASGRGGVLSEEIQLLSEDAHPEVPPETLVLGHDATKRAARLGLRSAPAKHAPTTAIARVAAARIGMEHTRPAPLYVRPADAAPASDLPPVILP